MIERPDPSDVPGPLDTELRALLDDAARRDALDPAFGDAAGDRVLQKVEAALRRPPAAPGRLFGARSGVMLASVCLLAMVAGSKLLGGDDARVPSPRTVSSTVAPERSAPATAPVATADVPSMHVDDLPSSASVPAAPPPARVAPRTAPSAPAGSGLAEEYRLVEDARAKLAAKDHAGASRSIQEHDQRFPAGQLAQECESLHIQLLVETGRVGEARERAQAFRARFPNGLLVPSVARAIASSGADSNAP